MTEIRFHDKSRALSEHHLTHHSSPTIKLRHLIHASKLHKEEWLPRRHVRPLIVMND